MEVDIKLNTPLGQEWESAESLRVAIVGCLEALFRDRDFGQAVGMVSRELVENAIKYGDWEHSDPSLFQFSFILTNDEIIVQVSNPVSTDENTPKELLDAIDWIKQFSSPAEAYMARMQQVAEQPKDSKLSCLGLVRVAYEGNFELDAYMDDNNVIHIKATSKIENR
ncbi:hypothetical protein [Desulfatibacillum aliphaticivorans]|uniref:hypothetical protein n=1 Tax=Desulfatibacillum aliphaticivorans TaxID=218208 RepID=UPI0003FF6B50|nr:hypothetical protein [Desulfatibacillum aliphaticivorans]